MHTANSLSILIDVHSYEKTNSKTLATFFRNIEDPKTNRRKNGFTLRSVTGHDIRKVDNRADSTFDKDDPTLSLKMSILAKNIVSLVDLPTGSYSNLYGTTYNQIRDTPIGLLLSNLQFDAIMKKIEPEVFKTLRLPFWIK